MIVLPAYTVDEAPPPHPSKEVTKVALRLKYQIEQLVPCEIGNDELSNPNSRIITKDVVHTATQAGGDELRGCVVFALLLCVRWFKIQASIELWDSDLHESRALASEVIAKHMYVVPPVMFLERNPC